MILAVTGKLIGERFDYPGLDTLIMAMPVPWKSVVEQYAGRLNRDYEGKDLLTANKEIIIASPVISGPKIEELIQLLKNEL